MVGKDGTHLSKTLMGMFSSLKFVKYLVINQTSWPLNQLSLNVLNCRYCIYSIVLDCITLYCVLTCSSHFTFVNRLHFFSNANTSPHQTHSMLTPVLSDESSLSSACPFICVLTPSKHDTVICSGWPSFFDLVKEGSITQSDDYSYGMHRVETSCSQVRYSTLHYTLTASVVYSCTSAVLHEQRKRTEIIQKIYIYRTRWSDSFTLF